MSGILCFNLFIPTVFHLFAEYIKNRVDSVLFLEQVAVKTLQRWDREGILKANRTPTDRRYYTYDQYLQFKGINIEHDKRKVVIYARVSTKNQRDDFKIRQHFCVSSVMPEE